MELRDFLHSPRLKHFTISAVLASPATTVPGRNFSLDTSHVHLVGHFIAHLPCACETVSMQLHLDDSSTTDQVLAFLASIHWDAMAARVRQLTQLRKVECRAVLPESLPSCPIALMFPYVFHYVFRTMPNGQGVLSPSTMIARAHRNCFFSKLRPTRGRVLDVLDASWTTSAALQHVPPASSNHKIVHHAVPSTTAHMSSVVFDYRLVYCVLYRWSVLPLPRESVTRSGVATHV